MKKQLCALFMAFMAAFALQAQVVYEDFEGGTSDLGWAAGDGIYNGVVANPGPDAVNGSGFVGSYTKAAGFGYSLFWVPSLAQPLDLSTNNLFRLKVWCSTATPILLKFEGPGQAVEKKVDMPAANQWVDLEFDMSAGAGLNNLTKIIIFFDPGNDPSANTYYFDDLVAGKAEKYIETFEAPTGINWIALNGTFNGPIANPGISVLNNTATVGSYTNNPAEGYNFAFGTLPSTLDMASFNQFHVWVWVPAAGNFLFKLEGAGEALEKIKFAPNANAWQELTFDMSAAKSFTTLNKILMVYKPGETGVSDTYYFDNIYATPDLCPGVARDADVLDDFECNRNANFAYGYDSLHVVNNPAVNVDNPSKKVAAYNDAAGPGSEWSPIVIESVDPFDLSVKNQLSVQVWSPKTGKLLLKLEGGPNPAKEVFVDITETNKWVTYTGDFSSQVGKGHRKWVLFFNAGVNGEAGDIYHFDNLKVSAKTALPPLEDFQDQLHLGWQPLNNNTTVHGAFTGPVANPAPNAVNGSTQVGCYTKGVSAFSTLQAFAAAPFDLSVSKQFNLDVLSPAAGGTVTMQLSSATQGNKSVDVAVTTAGAWETLGFDFSAYDAITDFTELRLIFNNGSAAQGEKWCIDNLRQGLVTVNPCAGVVAIPQIIDDYECQRNYTSIFYGTDDIKSVNNPYLTAANGSLKVGEYTDPAGQAWAGLGMEFGSAFDLSIYNHLKMLVYAPASAAGVQFLFKLEGGTQPAVEKFVTLPGTGEWVKIDVDFSAAAGTDHKKLVIFPNAGNENPVTTYYFDNIRWARAGINGCADDHETAVTSISNFKYFANGHLESEGYQFEIVDNPNKSGINTSSNVGKFVKASDGLPFAGMYADLEAPLDFRGVQKITAKVHMDHIGNFAVKLEGDAVNGYVQELIVPNTQVGKWEQLTYDFPLAPSNSEFARLTLFFDLTIDATGADVVSYFDDIVVGDGACGIIPVFNPLPVEAFLVSPNPVSTELRIENFREVTQMHIFNAYGQRVATLMTANEIRTEINVANFPTGVYTIAGFNAKGILVGNAKFIKQ